jgi:hypothetical protein
MKKTGCGMVAGLLVSLMYATAHGSPPTVNAEPMDLTPDISAKIGMEKSKHSTIADGMKQGQGSSSSNPNCGTVNVASGSSGAGNKPSDSIKEMFGKQQTTIVTGPIINMANCK